MQDPQAVVADVVRGEDALRGFRNRDVCSHLFAQTQRDQATLRRNAARVSRRLKTMHHHGLIAKIPHTHRCRSTPQGRKLMAYLLTHREELIRTLLPAAA